MADRYVIGADALTRAFRRLRDRDIPGVLHRTINAVAVEAKERETRQIAAVFEAPTPYTMRAVYVQKAKRKDMTAYVGIRDEYTPKREGRQASYLGVHETGGYRPHTRFEWRLIHAGVIDRGEWIVPAEVTITRGTYTQVLSQLNALREGSKSGSYRSKRSRQRSGSVFVTGGREVGLGGVDLPRGIWRRHQGAIEPIFWITRNRPQYTARLHFEDTARLVVNEQLIRIARAEAAKTLRRNRARGYR